MAFTLRLDDDVQATLRTLADQEGVSQQEVVRRAIIERAERGRHKDRVAGASQRGRELWGDVLDRLGGA